MRSFKVGDRVEALDDNFEGTVTRLEGALVIVEDEDGFELEFDAKALVLQKNDLTRLSQNEPSMAEVIAQKEASNKPGQTIKKRKERHRPTFVVDLHIHQLTDSTKGMTNFDMLNLQVDTARSQLEFAIKKRMPKMVFIHGVGEGVLRQELNTLLSRYSNVAFYDADFRTYGAGATEVKIFQNSDV
ncbi:DNA mismatch repair protein MutS [Winogradskyella maritima]|uniref:Smr/MutS family protein n=1 Tax=Winogradskyella maritima TaxID=1517766 RepID=A0ABV8AIT2_9FLAO|nr:DNA mismatch repair protein MutS [Winogradskyella maritima]